ncbi:MAG: hypothetical protein IKN96_00255 [Oscillibacter sp.]|nr:hypothetical protein [Oscillibacter sp.]
MKKLVKSFKALILAALMVSVLCVTVLAQANTYNVKSRRSFTFYAGSSYSTNYVSVRNYGPSYLTVYDKYGHTWELAPNHKVAIGVGRNQTREIYVSPKGGNSDIYVATCEGRYEFH